ncbi:MAG TPA: hypothetical protein PKA06_03485 [Gemmatales bacterium]|nr:hypothetical protein [Gemmatales bacterium]
MKMRRNYQPRLECLEARDVPAFSITQSNAVLFLKGTRHADFVLIEDLGNNDIQITQNGTSSIYSGINRINVKAGPGSLLGSFALPSALAGCRPGGWQ